MNDIDQLKKDIRREKNQSELNHILSIPELDMNEQVQVNLDDLDDMDVLGNKGPSLDQKKKDLNYFRRRIFKNVYKKIRGKRLWRAYAKAAMAFMQ